MADVLSRREKDYRSLIGWTSGGVWSLTKHVTGDRAIIGRIVNSPLKVLGRVSAGVHSKSSEYHLRRVNNPADERAVSCNLTAWIPAPPPDVSIRCKDITGR